MRRTSPIFAIPPRACGRNLTTTDKAHHRSRVNEWSTECTTHIFPSKNLKFTHPEKKGKEKGKKRKMCPAPSTWMDGVYRVVRWAMRGFDAADSERTVRRESPTSPPSTSLHSHANKNSGKGGKGKAPERENPNYALRDSRKRIALHSRKGILDTLPRGRCTTYGREIPPHP